MPKPVLIIINGLPGSGKTTLAKRLAYDLHLPVFSRDSLYEAIFDALEGDPSPLLGSASFRLLYHVVGSILTAGQSLVVEGFFGRPERRTVEFTGLQQQYDFEPFQILCKADGPVLLERFLVRAGSPQRHPAHADMEWLETNRERLLRGHLLPLAIGGQLVEIDTNTTNSFDYPALLRQVQAELS